MRKEERKKFIEIGICVSASFLCMHGMPAIAAEMLKEYGITKKQVEQIADKYDRRMLLPLYDTEAILMR